MDVVKLDTKSRNAQRRRMLLEVIRKDGATTARRLTTTTKFCRKKLKEHSTKSVTSDEGHTFAFKVTVESEDCEFVHDVNSLLVDTGATTHIVNDKTMFSSFQKDFDPAKHYIELADGSRMNKLAEGRG